MEYNIEKDVYMLSFYVDMCPPYLIIEHQGYFVTRYTSIFRIGFERNEGFYSSD